MALIIDGKKWLRSHEVIKILDISAVTLSNMSTGKHKTVLPKITRFRKNYYLESDVLNLFNEIDGTKTKNTLLDKKI